MTASEQLYKCERGAFESSSTKMNGPMKTVAERERHDSIRNRNAHKDTRTNVQMRENLYKCVRDEHTKATVWTHENSSRKRKTRLYIAEYIYKCAG